MASKKDTHEVVMDQMEASMVVLVTLDCLADPVDLVGAVVLVERIAGF